MGTGPITIVLADDHTIFRDALGKLLETEPDLRVVGDAADAEGTLRLIRELRPDIVLLDLAMPGRSGLDVLRELAGEPHTSRVLVLAAAVDGPQMVEALELGARGVLLKEAATSLLLKAIRVVHAGQIWVGRESVSGLVEGLQRARRRQAERAAERFGLTARQVSVVRLVVEGATNREIAERLGITEDTVKQHLSSVYDKCGVSNRVELALFATHHQVVRTD